MKKNHIEVIEYGGEIWINEKHLEKKNGVTNIADRTQYYSSEFKKMRCKIQECCKCQPCRIFIKNTLAVEITISSVKTQAVIFRNKFWVNQHDEVLCKQQSLSLTLKKLFRNENTIEEYYALYYRTDITFKKHILVVEIGGKGHVHRDRDYERKRLKEIKKLGFSLIRINPDKIDFKDYEKFGRVSAYITESTKKQAEKSTEKTLIDHLSKRLLLRDYKEWVMKKIKKQNQNT